MMTLKSFGRLSGSKRTFNFYRVGTISSMRASQLGASPSGANLSSTAGEVLLLSLGYYLDTTRYPRSLVWIEDD